MSDSHTGYEPHPTSAMDRQWKRVVQRRELEAMLNEYYAMEDRVAELEEQRDRLREALEKCRAYAVHPVSLDDCFVIFNAADAALQEAGDE